MNDCLRGSITFLCMAYRLHNKIEWRGFIVKIIVSGGETPILLFMRPMCRKDIGSLLSALSIRSAYMAVFG